MNFKIFLIIYLQLIYTSLANLQLTTEDVVLPTKPKEEQVDIMKFFKTVIDKSNPLILTFKFEARNNIFEKEVKYFFNGKFFDLFLYPDIKSTNNSIKGQKIFNLTFTKLSTEIIGEYMLQITATDGSVINATSNIFSPPLLDEFPTSIRAIEGNRVEVNCTYTAHPRQLDDFNWKEIKERKEIQYRLDARFSNESNFKKTIIWDILRRDDAGYYRCFARNKYGNDTVILQLRVKDKLAPLWPFIGIVIEVIILFAVIVFYERKKSSKKAAEMDANPTRQSLLADTKSSEINEGVRHRNSVD